MSEEKKILSVTIKQAVDNNPDSSYLGEFGNHAKSEYVINHKNSNNYNRHDYPWFNPPVENYKDLAEEDIKKYCQRDYERMISLNEGHWCFLGIIAEAEIQLISSGAIQTVTSGGLLGVESDSEDSYKSDIKSEQLDELREQLEAIGFSAEYIEEAYQNMKREI